MIMAFQGLLRSFSAPAANLISAGQTVQEMRTQMERVEDVMQYPPPDVNDSGGPVDKDVEYDKLSGAVEMKNAFFGYSRLDAPLIENFSLSPEARQPGGLCERFRLRQVHPFQVHLRPLPALERGDPL